MRIFYLLILVFVSIQAVEISPAQLELLKQSGYEIPKKQVKEKKSKNQKIVNNIINENEENSISNDETDNSDKVFNYNNDKLNNLDELNDKFNTNTKNKNTMPKTMRLKRFASNFFKNSNKIDPYSLPIPLNYKLARGDVLSLNIYGSSDKNFSLKIDRKGVVLIPQVGELKLIGLTFEDAKKFIIQKVQDAYPSNTSILVNIEEFTAIQVTLSGLVKAPGLYNLSSFSTIKDALIASGGILESGSYRNISLKRAGKIIKNYDLYQLVKYGNDNSDTLLQTGDIIYVKSIKKELSISGAVNIPGIFELQNGDTFKNLLAFASGLKAKANKKAIRLKRFLNNDKIKVYTLSLNELYRFKPANGDELYFSTISEQAGNYITLEGNVTNVGAIEIPKDKRLSTMFKNLFKDFGKNGIFKKNTNYSYAKVENVNISKVFNLKNLLEGKDEIYLKNGDQINIYKLGEFKDKPFFYVNGTVVSQTKKKEYEYYKGLRAKDLFSFVIFNNEISSLKHNIKIKNTENIYNNIYDKKELKEKELNVDKSKIQIKRVENNKYHSYTIDLNKNPNFKIRAYDVITFFAISELNNLNQASIRGEVFIPNTYNITENTHLKDLINLAGGFTKKASKTRFELVRYNIIEDERVREVKTLSLQEALKRNIKIFPDDEITIRGIANWYKKAYVTIKGEIKYPGKYAIIKGEKLSNLIKRAGGFTSNSFLEGSIFTRKSVKELQIKRMQESMDQIRKKALYASSSPTEAGQSNEDKARMVSSIKELEDKVNENTPIGRIAINIYFDEERFKNSEYDITLENEDSLFIPTINDTVSVVGEVLNQNTFVYNSKFDVNDYINRAGGMSDIADDDMIYVVKANGDAIRYKKSYFFSDNIEVFKGDTIVVPLKFDTISDIKFAKDVTSILYQLAVTAASLKTVGAL